MQLKNFIAVFLGGALALLLLTACGSKAPNDKTIMEDFNNSEMSHMVINNQEVRMLANKVEVGKSQVEKREATYWCVMEQSNYYYTATAEYILPYVYYDKGGWMLENPTRTSEPEITLLHGVSEEFLSDSVSQLTQYYESAQIVSRATNLVAGTDEIVLNFTGATGGDFMSDGQVTVLFTFVDNAWVPRATSAIPANAPVTEQAVARSLYPVKDTDYEYRNLQFIDRTTDLQNMTDTFRFSADQIFPNAVRRQTLEVVYTCDNTLIWRMDMTVLDESLLWTLEGDWIGDTSLVIPYPHRLVLTVHSVGEDSITVSLTTYDKSLNKIKDVLSNATYANEAGDDPGRFEFSLNPGVALSGEYFRIEPDSFVHLRHNQSGVSICSMRRE